MPSVDRRALPAKVEDPHDDLRNLIAEMAPDELAYWYDTSDKATRQLIDRMMAEDANEGVRAHPARLAATLKDVVPTGSYQMWPYVELLSMRFADLIFRRRPRQLWKIPSQYGKTSMCSRVGPIWALDLNPRLRIMYVSYDADKAVEEAGNTRDVIEANSSSLRFRLRPDRRARGMWKTDEGGGFYATGIGGAITGFPADVVIGDDLIKGWMAAHSETNRETAWNVYRSQMRLRIQRPDDPILLAGTCWHEDDVLARASTLDGLDTFENVRLPAIAEAPSKEYPEPDLLGRAPGQVLEPDRFPEPEVRARARVLGCTPAETPIVMADWSIRPIADVRAGDRVLGFVQAPGHNLRWVESVVEETMTRSGAVANFRMESGRVIRATRDHRWAVRAGRPYQKAAVGTPLRFSVPIDPDPGPDDGGWWQYLAGLVDGEGHVSPTRRLNLVQGTDRGAPVAAQMMAALDALSIPYKATHLPSRREAWQPRVSIDVTQCGRVYRHLVRFTHLAKRHQAIACLYEGAGRSERHLDRVISIDGDTEEPIFALQTSTGNYVAWGYLSSNSYLAAAMEQQRPAPEEGLDIKRAWFKLDGRPPARFDQVATSWDMKLKDNEQGDYVVGLTVGRVGGDYWILSMLRGQWDQATTRAGIALAAVRDPRITAHYYENTGYGPEVAAQLRKAVPGYVVSDEVAGALGATVEERYAIEAIIRTGVSALIPVNPKGPKPVRARAVAPIAEAGNVHLDPLMVGVDTFLTEVSSFPNGAHDDIVDAWSQALSRMSRGVASVDSPVDLPLRIERPSPNAIIAGLRRR